MLINIVICSIEFIFISFVLQFTLHSCLHDLLLFFKCSSVDLFNIFSECDFLFTAISVLLLIPLYVQQNTNLPKDCFNFIIEALSTVSHVENLQSLFNGNSSLESLIIHQELDQIEQFSRLKSSIIRNTSFVHCLELFFAHIPIKIIINFLFLNVIMTKYQLR